MADEEIAFQLMRLYRTLRGPADARTKEGARREIDRLLREFESRQPGTVSGTPHEPAPRLHG